MKRRTNFIKKPYLEGGRQYLKEFLKENLRYPKEALEKGIQGDVLISFSVNNLGEILNPQVVKGIGYGCDEEALRVVNLLRYQEVKNRGLRITTSNRLKIPFRFKREEKTLSLQYSISLGKASPKPKAAQEVIPKTTQTYSYKIDL